MNKCVKKKGSSLIVVIAVTSIIFVLAIAMLGMMVTGYKSRVAESKRLQDMYESDSRLDVVYNIIRKTSEATILKAGKDVETEEDEDKQNKDFKNNFYNYLLSGLDLVDTSQTYLKQCILDFKYPEYKVGGKIDFIYLDNKYKDADIKITEFNHVESEKKICITVQSTFETKGEKNKNSKTIETKFVINSPDYKRIDVSKGTDIEMSPVYDGKIITADGDMTDESNKIKAKGNIWVKGIGTEKMNNYSVDKYNGGIKLNGVGSDVIDEKDFPTLIGDIYTARTVNIGGSKTSAKISGNIYSSNTYLGGSGSASELLTISGDLITNNDLTLDSAGSNAVMKNYYGINDKTVDYSKEPDLAARESSCIIVNNTDAKLTVSEDACIMGVAYIDTKEKYQTGESVAIKGNYVAYTDPGTSDKVILKYYDPLQLIEFKVNATLQDKVNHFVNFFDVRNSNRSNNIEKAKGITFNKIYSAGAYVDNNGAHGNATLEEQAENEVKGYSRSIDSKKDEFAINVLAMGSTFGLTPTDSNNLVGNIYNQGKVVRTVGDHSDNENEKEDIGNNAVQQIDFGKIKEKKFQIDELDDFYGKVILRGKGEKVKITPGKIIIDDNESIDLNEEDMRALIVTNGDVQIDSSDGEINFTGNIITSGNVYIEGSNIINLVYDKDVTNHIYAINKKYLDEIFINRITDPKVHVNFKDDIAGSLIDYDENGYLKKGIWKIIK
ncbi:hypothetical protein [Clostridium cibarium]|uniref:Polymer-forming cytoskeletal n=1 Tax=Clostridium cibarium TaxID=2762247 RepID=A0ABR8PU21_9CLOT|nr:hypothetical protein [Clostridium cibarium]MBD7911674.1 hypothetical protein [Clostridium cibarium]